MPQIIFQADTPDGRIGAVTLAERAAPADRQNEHYVAQLIERVRWALIHADWHGSPDQPLDARPQHRVSAQTVQCRSC
jgi:hypothetical protein